MGCGLDSMLVVYVLNNIYIRKCILRYKGGSDMNNFAIKTHYERIKTFIETLDFNNPVANENLCFENAIVDCIKAHNENKNSNICLGGKKNSWIHCWVEINNISIHHNINKKFISQVNKVKELEVLSTWSNKEFKEKLFKFFEI